MDPVVFDDVGAPLGEKVAEGAAVELHSLVAYDHRVDSTASPCFSSFRYGRSLKI